MGQPQPPIDWSQYQDKPSGSVDWSQYADQSSPVKGVPEVNIQPAPPSGAAHPINWLTNAMSDIEQGGDSTWLGKLYKAAGGQPIQAGAGGGNPSVPVNRSPMGPPQILGGPAVGPLQAMRGTAEFASGHPIVGTNDVVGGVARTAAPVAMLSPAALPTAAAAVGAGKVGNAAGQAAGLSPQASELVGNIAALGAGAGAYKSLQPKAPPVSPARASVLDAIYRSINPPVNDVEGFKANLNNQFDTVVNYARQNNLPLNTRADFNTALQGAAAADPYRAQFIEPFKNDMVPVLSPKYQGDTIMNGTHTTIGQMDARLSAINDELYPRYMKGGQGSSAAQAAINSGDAARLSAEANMIRGQLAQEISKRTGVDPETIRSARKNYEQIRSLAEDTTYSLNKENEKYNTEISQPTTFGGAVQKLKNIPINPQNWQTNPLGAVRDRMFSGAVRNYQPPQIDPITFQPRR